MKHIAQLYAKASNGKTKVWRCDVNDKGEMITTHGYYDGELTTATKAVKGKNIGKSNETTPFQQACLEAESKMRKKLDEGYVADMSKMKDSQSLNLPMLAHKFIERKHDIIYPAMVQPKLNGIRDLADYDVSHTSRNGKPVYTLGHLDQDIMKILSELGVELQLDGEIFVKDWNFQEIVRAYKKDRGPQTKALEYWVFDCTMANTSFEYRYKALQNAFAKVGKLQGQFYTVGNVKLVPTFQAKDEAHVMKYQEDFVKQGYEGTIIRNKAGLYVFKHRSKDLQKYKDFIDEEFKIVGGHEGTGEDVGTIVFECQTKDGKVFSVRPKGSREIRREWLEELNSIKGLELTVRYQNLSEDGIPIFPVGLEIRDYE